MSLFLRLFGISVISLALSLVPCSAWTGFPGKGYEGWPKIVADLSGPNGSYKNFRISISPAADQTGAGTGGAIEDIKVKNTNTGRVLQIETQCVDVRILEIYHGFPQLELWGRGGGGSFSRRLFRVEKGKYKAIRDDLFDANINDALRKDVTASVPGYQDTIYYTGTMYPQNGDEQ